MMSVESLYDSSESVSRSAIASSKACFAMWQARSGELGHAQQIALLDGQLRRHARDDLHVLDLRSARVRGGGAVSLARRRLR